MNLAKELKKKRDAEKRLEQNSPMPIFIGGSIGGNIENNTYISNENIVNNFNNINNEIITINEIINGGGIIQGKAFEPLTTGDIENPELLFVNGDILSVEV